MNWGRRRSPSRRPGTAVATAAADREQSLVRLDPVEKSMTESDEAFNVHDSLSPEDPDIVHEYGRLPAAPGGARRMPLGGVRTPSDWWRWEQACCRVATQLGVSVEAAQDRLLEHAAAVADKPLNEIATEVIEGCLRFPAEPPD
jgi:hypothetical protein